MGATSSTESISISHLMPARRIVPLLPQHILYVDFDSLSFIVSEFDHLAKR